MLGFRIDQAKHLFFDRQAVTGAVDKGTLKGLSRFGAFVRRDARTSIRKAKKTSQPGEPPKSKTGLLRDFLFFVMERASRSVLIGPAKINGKGEGDSIPETLEKGGRVRRRRLKLRRGRKAEREVYNATYDPRPFMAPAFEKNLPKVPAIFQGIIRP
jgi:hypothetical protein